MSEPEALGDAVLTEILPWARTFEENLEAVGVDVTEYEKQIERARKREERHALIVRLKDSGARVNKQLAKAIVSGTLEQTESVIAVRTWLDVASGRIVRQDCRRPVVFVLSGSLGIGKTAAAAYALAHEGGTYVTATELGERMSAPAWRREGPSRPSGPLVVVDDLGTERHKDFNSALLELIDWRMHRPGLLTMLTSNLGQEALRKRYDARLIDRLHQCATFIEFTGKSKRLEP